MRRTIVIIILAGFTAGFTSITGNIVSNTLPETWKPYLWIAWPLFIAFTAIGIGLTTWQVSAQKPVDESKASRQTQTRRGASNKKVQATIQEHKRVYRVLGLPVWSVSEYQEKREYHVLGIPVWLWVSHSPSLPATTLAAISLGLVVGGGTLVYSGFPSKNNTESIITSTTTAKPVPITEEIITSSELEQKLLEANILLTGTPASPEYVLQVQERLNGPDYQALSQNILGLMEGKRFKNLVHLDKINGIYILYVDPGAQYGIATEKYGDSKRLEAAILVHWNELNRYSPANSFDEIVEPRQ